MKKLFLLSLIALSTLHASESSWDLTQVTFNKDEFKTQSGFLERGIYGYLCCFPLTPARYMRKRLKEKDLLYNGKPLVQHAQADDILSAFVEKHNLSVCPFKSKKELDVNRVAASAVPLQMCCTPFFSYIVGLSALLGSFVGCATGSCDYCCMTSVGSSAAFGLPYILAAMDAFDLAHCYPTKIGIDTPKKEQ